MMPPDHTMVMTGCPRCFAGLLRFALVQAYRNTCVLRGRPWGSTPLRRQLERHSCIEDGVEQQQSYGRGQSASMPRRGEPALEQTTPA
eukprot:366322-Chlamydomonas_euryale.AAC.13